MIVRINKCTAINNNFVFKVDRGPNERVFVIIENNRSRETHESNFNFDETIKIINGELEYYEKEKENEKAF